MNSLVQTLKEMNPAKLFAIIGGTIAILGFFIFLSTRLSTPMMAPLYTGLSIEDSGQIVEELEKKGVPYTLDAGGAQISVPSDQVLRLRMGMAQEGLPSQGNIIGYEIFDRSDKLGTSSFVHNVNMLRALEGELARTINSFQNVENARVHLVLPKRELFSREKQEPSASVAVTLRGGNTLSKQEVDAIQHLVASSVPQMKPSQVTLVDNKGRLLARGGDEEAELGAGASIAAEYRLAYEKRMREMIEGLLEKTIGRGKVRAEVTADIDFDRVVTNSETFDPEGQVARSTQTTEESESSRARNQEDNVTVGNQLPDASADKAGNTEESQRASTDELVNYEISKVVENHVKETGSVKRLSVAVLVDGIYVKQPVAAPAGTDAKEADADEEPVLEEVYTPRSQEELDKIATLIRSAVGYDETRGDAIQVVNMQFSERVDAEEETGPFDWLKEDLQGIIQTLVIGIVAILAILLIIRPIVNRVIEISAEAREEEEDAAAAEQLALLGPDLAALTDQSGSEGADEEMIDIARIQGKVRSAAVRKVQDILENNPEEALTALRQWMGERGAPAS